MADQRSSIGLSPQLQAVLSSLNINLEAELNRYRRNRFAEGSADDDLLTDLDAAAFDFNVAESEPAEIGPATPLPSSPPPVPRNKKLFPNASAEPVETVAEVTGSSSTSSSTEANNGIEADSIDTVSSSSAHLVPVKSLTQASSAAATSALTGSLENPLAAFPEERQEGLTRGAIISNKLPNGYLASSEKLIESLKEVPPMPEMAVSMLEPKRKTRSLLAGAILGFLGLVAGLGASYLMSNPLVARRLANGFRRDAAAIAPDAKPSFDPPGPDLSAREFIDIDIDNLSSLTMPQTTIDPANRPTPPVSPASQGALPPISVPPAITAATAPTNQSVANQPTTDNQAVAIPAGTNYYITVPFSTEQGLLEIRQIVNEAFVRQFADGVNRIQLAAFENLDFAQQFADELKTKGITAQVYGPTPE